MSSGSEKRQRKHRLTIRFSDPERDRLNENAERAGVAVSSFARSKLIDSEVPRAARRPPVEKALLSKTLGELGKIGSNVNQIARQLNAEGVPRNLSRIEADIRQVAEELTRMRNAILSALGRGKAG